MIIVNLKGGLGNQLFQYAAGKALAERHQTELKLDLSWFQASSSRQYQLHHFAISAEHATQQELKKFTGKYKSITKKIWWQIKSLKNQYRVYKEPSFNFNSELLQCGPNTLIEGYWQSERYFQGISPIIRQELRILTPLSKQSHEMKDKIINHEAVGIHIRRGDYIELGPQATSIHGPLDPQYYDTAIAIIEKKINNPHLFIFSDDISWAKKSLHFKHTVSYVDHNDENTGFEDLYLMSQCKHNIIANSTFSWWGAWLNHNPSKIIIAPNQWFRTTEMNKLTDNLMPDSWIKI